MENELFELSVQAAMRIPPKNVIGTKSEHRVHGALKYFFQPCDDYHEIKLEGFICDATDSEYNEVFEIQTRDFSKLRKKLQHLLLSHPVTVIHPITVEKRLTVIYEESGEASVRKSPKKAVLDDIFDELYRIRDYLPCPNLRILAAEIKVHETRVYKGLKGDRKPFQKPISVERVPTELVGITEINYPDSYLSKLPSSLPECFTSGDLARESNLARAKASFILKLLTELGFVTRVGRDKRGYIYERAHP